MPKGRGYPKRAVGKSKPVTRKSRTVAKDKAMPRGNLAGKQAKY